MFFPFPENFSSNTSVYSTFQNISSTRLNVCKILRSGFVVFIESLRSIFERIINFQLLLRITKRRTTFDSKQNDVKLIFTFVSLAILFHNKLKNVRRNSNLKRIVK